LPESRYERVEWTSLIQLVHDLIGGATRRHTFSNWELQLLLDLQLSTIRKSSRPDVLRRYARVLQQQNTQGVAVPIRFSEFWAAEAARKQSPTAVPLSNVSAAGAAAGPCSS
jgi:hypothetical protein